MKQIYTNENRLLAMNSKNILVGEGISVELRNEYTSGGAIPGHQVWLELWVDDADYDRALDILKANESSGSESWVCSKCQEKNYSSFKICWNCQSEDS